MTNQPPSTAVRLTLLSGVVCALLGAAGLLFFGTAVIQVFEILIHRFGEPLPESLELLGRAAVFGSLFAIGCLLANGGWTQWAQQQAAGKQGGVCYAAAGAVMLVAAILFLIGVVQCRAGFVELAQAGETPRPSTVQDFMAAASVFVINGFRLLLVVPVLMRLSTLVGRRAEPAPPPPAAVGMISLIVTALAGLAFAGAWVLCWRHAGALEALLQPSATPKAAQLAAHLMAILNLSLLSGAMLMVLALATIAAGALPLMGRRT